MNLLTIGSNMLLCTWAPGGGGGARVDARPPPSWKRKSKLFSMWGWGFFLHVGGKKFLRTRMIAFVLLKNTVSKILHKRKIRDVLVRWPINFIN